MSGWVLALRALDKLGGEASTRAISEERERKPDPDVFAGLRILTYAAERFGVVERVQPGDHGRGKSLRWRITERGRAYLDGRLRLVRPPSGPKGGMRALVFEEARA